MGDPPGSVAPLAAIVVPTEREHHGPVVEGVETGEVRDDLCAVTVEVDAGAEHAVLVEVVRRPRVLAGEGEECVRTFEPVGSTHARPRRLD